jgi:hypothetical protein
MHQLSGSVLFVNGWGKCAEDSPEHELFRRTAMQRL